MTMAMSMSPYFVSEESGADSDDLQISGWRSASSSRRSSSSSRRSSLGNPSLTGLRSAPPSTVFAEELEDELSFKESQSQAEPWKPNAYIKIGELGRGTFGIVYKCLCVDNNRHFVVKEMEACNHTYRQLAENEVSLLKNIDHKRIIRYYESEMEQDAVTLYTEFMLGGSVLRAIKKYGPLAEKVVLKYTRQLIEALAYIHEKGIVHNDIKCDNLLLDDEDNLKLGDFGSAVQKTVEEGLPTFSPCEAQFGVSLYWSAPEVLNYEEFSCSADIWSLGCTIVEMFTTEPPFYKVSEEEFLASVEARILSYDPECLIPKASPSMQLFLSLLLQNDNGKRPQTGSEAEVKLNQIF